MSYCNYGKISERIEYWTILTPWGSIKSLLIKDNKLTLLSPFPPFDQWYFTSLMAQRSRNEKITEIKAGSLSWCLFTRLLPAGSLCSSPLARVTQKWKHKKKNG